MTIRKLKTNELRLLTQLFNYKDVEGMLEENTKGIENGTLDIFGAFEKQKILGELHIKYESEDLRFAKKGKRAYFYTFRVHKDYQGKGIGTQLLKDTIELLINGGYTEFTVGVEDDNVLARYMYEKQGFTVPVARIKESYQGDSYEYDLLLKKAMVQPEIIRIEKGLRLRKFDGNIERMVKGYKDPVVHQNSEGIFNPKKIPDRNYIIDMCDFLKATGEFYFIEVLEKGRYVSVGDVTIKPENPSISIWQEKYRGIGMGTKVMKVAIKRLTKLGYKKIIGTTIFKWNTTARKMLQNLGFVCVNTTNDVYIYELDI